jgi:hypothetical protein
MPYTNMFFFLSKEIDGGRKNKLQNPWSYFFISYPCNDGRSALYTIYDCTLCQREG